MKCFEEGIYHDNKSRVDLLSTSITNTCDVKRIGRYNHKNLQKRKNSIEAVRMSISDVAVLKSVLTSTKNKAEFPGTTLLNTNKEGIDTLDL